MKLAKKVLAIVMALGLIACMSAMAFADGSFSVDATKSSDGKLLYVTVYANGYVGLASGKVDITYTGAQFKYARTGEQASLVGKAEGNSFTGETNDTTPGKVTYGFYFKENLWAAGTFKEAGTDAPLDINVAAFDLVTFTFDIDGVDAYEVNVTVNGKDIYGGSGSGSKTIKDAKVEVTTIKEVSEIPTNAAEEKKDEQGKPVEETKAEAADVAKTNTGAKTTPKTDGGKNTGDNGVIAVVAGVIALAGAAFVVTKKRK